MCSLLWLFVFVVGVGNGGGVVVADACLLMNVWWFVLVPVIVCVC